jgi:hypothetical protein
MLFQFAGDLAFIIHKEFWQWLIPVDGNKCQRNWIRSYPVTTEIVLPALLGYPLR